MVVNDDGDVSKRTR